MSDISKLKIDGETYNIKDEVARNKIQEIELTGSPGIATETDIGLVKGGDNVKIRTDGQMYTEITNVQAITNLEIDEICK